MLLTNGAAGVELGDDVRVAGGPTGTDVSTDDGVTWRPLRGPAAEGWNAVSGPFAVGPKGRVGRLRNDALRSAQAAGSSPAGTPAAK